MSLGLEQEHSGTVYIVAKQLGRRPLGIERLKDTNFDLQDADAEFVEFNSHA